MTVPLPARPLPGAPDLLPHAEAGARSWRNLKLGLIGIPLLVTGLAGTVVMAGVGVSGASGGLELLVLLGTFVATTLAGLGVTAHATWQYRSHPGCKALREGAQLRDVRVSWVSLLRGYRKLVTYTLPDGRSYSCYVPDDFPSGS